MPTPPQSAPTPGESGSPPLSETGVDHLWHKATWSSPMAYLVGVCQNGHSPKILGCNPAFEKITGFSPERALLRNPAELLQSDEGRHEWPEILTRLCSGQPVNQIVEARRSDNQRFVAHLHGYLLPHDNADPRLWVIMLADVTDAAGTLRREFENMDSLGTLAGGIAHDFNNLLAIILGYASLLRQVSPDNARILEYSETICDAARRGADVVRQLMVFANQHEPILAPTDAHFVLGDVLVRVTTAWPESIRLDYDFSARKSLLPLDADQVGHAVEHLLRNARESLSEAGVVTVRTRDRGALPDQNPALEWLEIQIEDNGCGMDEETRRRMFEPFFARHKGPEVRGIGLALVYGIVKAHRGHLSVRSAPGQGTCVSLFLPRPGADQAAAAQPTVAKDYQLHAGACILLIEDEEDLGRLWISLMARQNWELLWAKSAEEALSLFERHGDRIDVVFSDVGLPGEMDGWELCSRLRSLRPTLPILLASGYFKQSTVNQVHLAAPVELINKPYPPLEAIDRLCNLLRQKL